MKEHIINKAINGWDYQNSDRIFYHEGYHYDYVTDATDINLKDDGVEIILTLTSGKSACLTLAALTDHNLSFEFGPLPLSHEMPAFYLPVTAQPRHALSISEESDQVQLEYGELRVTLARSPFSLQIQRGRTQFTLSGKKVSRQPVTPGLGIRIDAQGHSETYMSWESKNGQHFYGLGEKFSKVEKSQARITSYVMDACATNSTDLSYKAHPILLCDAGYGVMMATARRTHWDVGHFCFESVSVLSESALLRGYLFFGDSLKALVQIQAEMQGKPDFPAPWTLGVWYSRCAYQTAEEVLGIKHQLETHRLPFDVLHLDVNWGKHYWYKDFWVDCCDFEWGDGHFPQPEAFLSALEHDNVACSVWINPYLPPGTAIYQDALDKNYLVKTLDGGIAHVYRRNVSEIGIPDLSNPLAYSWWKEHLKTLLRRGLKALKPDYADRIPENALFHNGYSGRDMHNAYIWLYAKVCYEATQEVHGTALVWKRPGFLGCGRFAGTWSGDVESTFEGLKHTLRGGLSVGFSGECYWSSDIAGFKGQNVDPELYIRWSQVGMLCSLARYHGVSPREPWHFGQQAVDIVRRYSQLRYRWLPLLLALGSEAQDTGLPLMRHLALEFADDPFVHAIDDQFMLGENVMVIPILEPGQQQRSVYLPAGRWYSLHEKRWYDGQCVHNLDITLEDIPVFIREGAIIPTFAEDIRHLKTFNHVPIVLQGYGNITQGSGTLIDENRQRYHWTLNNNDLNCDYPGVVKFAALL
ncbi:alpha-xylosidase [Superficieibacter sp.]|uniref:glycoside hydrolase family 31 protein n=1 Tax=Superficieibacter sp. TaxID=2303322 RepID=UPI0028AA02DB|nr:TIM-barrel domain-containing protein [Superficieibacter sp.]